jgi:DNA-binding PadR family transcriptional regulator
MMRYMVTQASDAVDSTLQEIRRGTIVLAVLAGLREEHYGYSLRQALVEGGLEVSEGTLYPLLRRLEGSGLLASRWELGEGRPRRYYRLSREGEAALRELRRGWQGLVEVLSGMLTR